MRPSPLLNRPGAVASAPEDPDQAVPAHLGDPGREQAALAEGRAACALARDVVTVTGPDRLSWLTTLSSQALTGLTPDDGGVETLLLDARGRISHALAALDDAETLWLVTEAGRGPALVEFLERMRFMLRVASMIISRARVVGKPRATSRLAAPGGSPLRAQDVRGLTTYDVRGPTTRTRQQGRDTAGSPTPRGSGAAVGEVVAQVPQVGAAHPHAPYAAAVGVGDVLGGVG